MNALVNWLCLTLILSSFSARGFEIPKQLSEEDRSEIVRTMGLSSSTKLLSNPYPLGGYSGLEVGYSVEFINVRDVQRLGCEPGAPGCTNTTRTTESEWRFSRLSVGKGLYNDVDAFFQFIPPTGGVKVSDYGGAVRWSFYQAQFLPINISLIGHANQLNFNNDFINRNVGAEIMFGVNVENFALYFGGGVLNATGTFIGGLNENSTADPNDPQINTETNTATVSVTGTHTVVGFCLHHENLFAAAQVDRYEDAVYSLKVGIRY